MAARLAISSNGRHGQYVGTTRAAPPQAVPGSPTARLLNGLSDRIVGRRSSDIGQNFMAGLTFWRTEAVAVGNDQTAARLFTQFCVGGTRLAVGLNRSFLSLTYTNASGATVTLESDKQVMDTGRHTVFLLNTGAQVIVYLDGRQAIKVNTTLIAPDTALSLFGADSGGRYFKGYIDDVVVYQTPPLHTENWTRFYRALVRNLAPRDYLAAPFAEGFNLVTLGDEGFSATGTLSSPVSKVALAANYRTEPELDQQFIEFKFQPGNNGAQIQIGVINGGHDLSNFDVGKTADSFAYTQDGRLISNNQNVVSGLPTWNSLNIMALGWTASTRTLSIWRDGEQIHSYQLPEGAWRPALNLGSNTVRMNSGRAPLLSLPADTPGIYAVAYSRLNTEMRHLNLGIAAALNDPGEFVLDTRTGVSVGVYQGFRTYGPGITPDSLDLASGVSGGIRINASPATTADDQFFFSVAFRPTADDLVGNKAILYSEGSWGLELVDGKIYAWVGEVQVGSSDVAFEADKSYLVGLARSLSTGKLLVWCHIGYMLQSGDATESMPSADVWVGSKVNGAQALQGRVSHLLLCPAQPANWKLERYRKTYEWDLPLLQGLIPNPVLERVVFEPSYRDVLASGIAEAPAANISYVAAVAQAPDSLATEYRMVSRAEQSDFTGEFVSPWTPTARLNAAMSRTATAVVVNGFDTEQLAAVQPGQAVLIDSEVMRLESINRVTGELTLARAAADTVPALHSAGAVVWFYGAVMASTRLPFPSAAVVDSKLLTRNPLTELPEDLAPTESIQLRQRLSRPYPAAGMKINDLDDVNNISGTMLVTWRHRNRVAQGSSLVAWNDPSVTAPADLVYRVRLLDANTGEVLHESPDLASTVGQYNLHASHTGPVTVLVSAIQGDLTAWQEPTMNFQYQGDVMVILNTEEGEALQTEDEQANVEAERNTALRTASWNGELPDNDDGEEEEEEDDIGGNGTLEGEGGSILGVKMSEFGGLQEFMGTENLPLFKDNTNYQVGVLQLIEYLKQNIPLPRDGKSSYELAVENGFEGTEQEWLASLEGPMGPSSNASRRILTITGASGPVVCNWANYDEIRVHLINDVTLTFQGARDGQGCTLKVVQPSLSSYRVTLPATVRYNALIQNYTASQNPGSVDKVGFMYDSADSAYDLVSWLPEITF